MVDRVVINTGPLIALAAADALEIAGQLPLQLICPAEVQRELFGSGAPGLGSIVVGLAVFVSAAIGPDAGSERLATRPFRVIFDFAGCTVAFCAAISFTTFVASRRSQLLTVVCGAP